MGYPPRPSARRGDHRVRVHDRKLLLAPLTSGAAPVTKLRTLFRKTPMTKRSFAVLVAIALVAGSIVGLDGLEAAKKAGPAKIGFVDLQRTLNETKVGKKARGRLEGEKAKKQKEIDAAQGDLQGEF